MTTTTMATEEEGSLSLSLETFLEHGLSLLALAISRARVPPLLSSRGVREGRQEREKESKGKDQLWAVLAKRSIEFSFSLSRLSLCS